MPNYRVSFQTAKPFGQFALGYRGRLFEAVFSQRLARVSFWNIRESGLHYLFERPTIVSDLTAAAPLFVIEPAVGVRVGREPIKVGFDLGFSADVSDRAVRRDEVVIGFGLYVSVPRR